MIKSVQTKLLAVSQKEQSVLTISEISAKQISSNLALNEFLKSEILHKLPTVQHINCITTVEA